MLDSQTFGVTEDQHHPYWSTPAREPTSSTQPNEPEFTTKLGLPNEELSPFSEDVDKGLRHQPQEDHEKEVECVYPITTVSPYNSPPHIHNFEKYNFEDFEYGHTLDCKEVQHPVGTFFEGMHFLTKEQV